MRILSPFLAASTLILAMAACSPKPAAESAETAPPQESAMAAEPADAGRGELASSTAPSSVDASVQERPQGMPAVPGRPRGRGKEGPTTLADMQARSERRFDRMDANGDGVVAGAEMDAGERGGRMIANADSNGDGRVTRAEMQAAVATRFRQMDGNGDGVITESERPQF